MMRREIRALIGSTGIAERRLIELLDKYGKETVLASIEEMMNRTEKAVRTQIAKWPEGTYYAEAKTDDDGAELGKPVTVRCRLTIKDGELTFDFSDSDAQADKGNINAFYSMTMSNTMSTCFLFFDPALAAYHNEGSLRPIHVIAREGTVVNARPGSRTALSPSITGTMVIECVLSVLSQALPQHAIAPYGKAVHLMFIGKTTGTDEMYVYISFCPGGGGGAVTGYDGYQCCTDMGALGVVAKADAEEEMVRFPWRVTKYEFLTDSAGAGKWRGAPGIWWEGINEDGDCTSTMGPCDGWYTQGEGQQGGHPTPFNRCHILRGSERIDITQPHVIQNVIAGDTFVCQSGGGAGIGLPEERDPEAVRMDVKNELVSIKVARDIYQVVVKPGTLEIDNEATQRLRAKG
jgi:N-methylhydantoinase B